MISIWRGGAAGNRCLGQYRRRSRHAGPPVYAVRDPKAWRLGFVPEVPAHRKSSARLAMKWRFRSPFIAPAGDPTLPRIPEGAIITSQRTGIRGTSIYL